MTANSGLKIECSDGSQKRPFHFGQDRQHVLWPNEGVGFIIFHAVPEDAPLGTSVFRTHALVGRVTGIPDGHRENPNPMIASDFARFEVTPEPTDNPLSLYRRILALQQTAAGQRRDRHGVHLSRRHPCG